MDSIGDEVLEAILSYLDVVERIRVSRVSRRFYSIALDFRVLDVTKVSPRHKLEFIDRNRLQPVVIRSEQTLRVLRFGLEIGDKKIPVPQDPQFWTSLVGLRELDIARCEISPETFNLIGCSCPNLHKLVLDRTFCPIDERVNWNERPALKFAKAKLCTAALTSTLVPGCTNLAILSLAMCGWLLPSVLMQEGKSASLTRLVLHSPNANKDLNWNAQEAMVAASSFLVHFPNTKLSVTGVDAEPSTIRFFAFLAPRIVEVDALCFKEEVLAPLIAELSENLERLSLLASGLKFSEFLHFPERFPKLRALGLDRPEGWTKLELPPFLRVMASLSSRLQVLDLTSYCFDGSFLFDHYPCLRKLSVSLGANLKDEHIVSLPTNCPLLEDISFCGASITDLGLSVLAQYGHQLKHLSLSSCAHITDDGLAVVLKASTGLLSLNLRNTALLTGASAVNIAQFCHRSLQKLDLRAPKMKADPDSLKVISFTCKKLVSIGLPPVHHSFAPSVVAPFLMNCPLLENVNLLDIKHSRSDILAQTTIPPWVLLA